MAMTDSARLAMLALPQYVRKQMELPTRKSYLLQEIRKRGRETTRNGGLNVEWRPKMDRNDLTWGKGNPNTISFPQVNLWTKATLDYKTAYMGASMSEIEALSLMDNPTRYFSKVKSMGDELATDFPIRFAPYLFVDGTGTDKIEGFESWLGTNGTTQPGEPIGNAYDTYAGLSTAPGGLGGDWTGPSGGYWPRMGTDPSACDFKYYCWTPLIVNFNDAELRMDTSTESAGWDDCWQYAMNYLTTYQRMLTSSVPDVFIIDSELLRRAENSMKASSQFQLSSAATSLDPAVKVVSWNGILFCTEMGVPANCVYGCTFDKLELKCMGDSFLKTDEETDFVTGDKLWKVSWHGCLWIESPVYFPAAKAVTSLGT